MQNQAVPAPVTSASDRTLTRRILALPAMAAAAFLLLLILSVVAGARNERVLQQIESGYYPAQELSRDLQDDLGRIQQALRDAVATGESDGLAETDRVRDQALERLDKARANPVLEAQDLSRLSSQITAYYDLARRTSERMIRKETGEDIGAALENMRERFNQLRQDLQQNRERHQGAMVSAIAGARAVQRQTVWWMVLTIVVCVVLVGFGAQYVVQSVTRPLRDAVQGAVQAAETMARGDLTARVGIRSVGEVDQLLSAIDQLAASWRRMIGQTQQGANDLASAASQILTSTRQTVQGAQEQAAAVHQTIATASELQQTVRVTEERAREIQEVMGRTSQSSQAIRAQLGDAAAVMARVRQEMETIVASIQDLSKRNLQIGEIIESVGEVADQTQLLAVNAGIEAAKAGDVGRGFSVVASEMKALADQTKKASSRIRAIVGEVQQAAAETTRVVATGQTRLQDAVRPVSDVMPLVEQLTTQVDASNQALRQILGVVSQQVNGIGQITDAMKTVQGASQEGLRHNQELERGAESLDRLGQQLRELVSAYRI